MTRNPMPFVVAILMAVLTAACANTPVSVESAALKKLSSLSRDALQTEARSAGESRWKLLFDKQYDQAFALYTEASKVGVNSSQLDNYMASLKPTSAKVTAVSCDQSKCELQYDLTIAMQIPRIGSRLMTVPLTETWVIEQESFKMIRPATR